MRARIYVTSHAASACGCGGVCSRLQVRLLEGDRTSRTGDFPRRRGEEASIADEILARGRDQTEIMKRAHASATHVCRTKDKQRRSVMNRDAVRSNIVWRCNCSSTSPGHGADQT